MNAQEYQSLAERTEPTDMLSVWSRLMLANPDGTFADPRNMRLMHAAFGMQTESGEFTDQLKKHIFYGKPLDETNLAEELGDQLWYIALACNALDIDMATVMETNIAKLQKRFPDKFTKHHALNRDLDGERAVLDGMTP